MGKVQSLVPIGLRISVLATVPRYAATPLPLKKENLHPPPPGRRFHPSLGRVAELADAQDLGSCGVIRAGSTPVAPTIPPLDDSVWNDRDGRGPHLPSCRGTTSHHCQADGLRGWKPRSPAGKDACRHGVAVRFPACQSWRLPPPVWWWCPGRVAQITNPPRSRRDELYESLILFEKQEKVWDSRSSSLRNHGWGNTPLTLPPEHPCLHVQIRANSLRIHAPSLCLPQ